MSEGVPKRPLDPRTRCQLRYVKRFRGELMFGPKRITSLDAFEYRLILSALEREVQRLEDESNRHRDAYDEPAWAEATSRRRLARSLRNRLDIEMAELPRQTDEERRWEQNLLLRSAGRIPRSKVNAEAHRADALKRRNAAAARRAAYWERRSSRARPDED